MLLVLLNQKRQYHSQKYTEPLILNRTYSSNPLKLLKLFLLIERTFVTVVTGIDRIPCETDDIAFVFCSPWISPGLLKSINKKNRLSKIY